MTTDLFLYLILASVLGGVLVLWAAWRRPAILVLAVVLSRSVLDSFSAVTYLPRAAGLSIMQIYTMVIMVVIFGYVLVRNGIPKLTIFVPVLLLLAVYFLSALITDTWFGAVEGLIRWSFLYGLAALVVTACRVSTARTVALAGWIALLYPLLNQLGSIINNRPSYNAGQFSYIGSFSHESDVSFLILAFIFLSLMLAVQSRGLSRILFGVALIYGHVALYLCNYRTAVVAVAVMWIVLSVRSWRYLAAPHKVLAYGTGSVIAVVGMLYIGNQLTDRLSDLFAFLSSPGTYLDFSGHARRTGLMSGRLDLINAYMADFLAAPASSWFFGLGVNSGDQMVGIYAHNEFISALVETGVFGLGALVFLIWRISRLASIRSEQVAELKVCLEAGLLSLIVMTLGTMPFRDMRALIAFGLLVGLAEAGSRRRSIKRVYAYSAAVPEHLRFQLVTSETDRPHPRY